jgi:DNA-binding NarL/FixJ family response regulator
VNRKRILLADDHDEFLISINKILSERYDIAGAVRDGVALVSAAQSTMPDLIVSDLSMPVMNGLQAAAKILEAGLTIPIILLTVESSPSYARKALSIGAMGYVLKTYASEQLPIAVAEVLAGRQYISPQIVLHTGQ